MVNYSSCVLCSVLSAFWSTSSAKSQARHDQNYLLFVKSLGHFAVHHGVSIILFMKKSTSLKKHFEQQFSY